MLILQSANGFLIKSRKGIIAAYISSFLLFGCTYGNTSSELTQNVSASCKSGEWCYDNFVRNQITDTMLKADFNSLCPSYKEMALTRKKEIWVKLVKAISYAESNWNPTSVYEENFIDPLTKKPTLSIGMMQISVSDKLNYKTTYCSQLDNNKIKDPLINLGCGTEIMNVLISRNYDIYNLGRYWSVMRKNNKRHKVVLENFSC